MKKQALLLGVISIGSLLSATGCSNTTYTVTFISNGGSDVEEQVVTKNAKVVEPEEPLYRPYVFNGWYNDETLTTKYDFSQPVTKNMNLYAKWDTAVSLTYKYHSDADNTVGIYLQCDYLDKISGNAFGLKIDWGNGDKTTLSAEDVKAWNWNNPFTKTYDNTQETYTITIHGLVEKIDLRNSGGFNGNRYIQSATINELTNVDTKCEFYLGNKNKEGDSSEISNITLPKNLITIPDEGSSYHDQGDVGALACTSLESFVLPSTITSIGASAFHNNQKLTEVDLSNATSLRSIGWGAFNGCTALKTLTFPESLASIDSFTFANCRSLETVTFTSYMPPYLVNEGGFYDSSGIKTIYVPKGRKAAYAEYWDSIFLTPKIKEVE